MGKQKHTKIGEYVFFSTHNLERRGELNNRNISGRNMIQQRRLHPIIDEKCRKKQKRKRLKISKILLSRRIATA